jgi:hypothetical protein
LALRQRGREETQRFHRYHRAAGDPVARCGRAIQGSLQIPSLGRRRGAGQTVLRTRCGGSAVRTETASRRIPGATGAKTIEASKWDRLDRIHAAGLHRPSSCIGHF